MLLASPAEDVVLEIDVGVGVDTGDGSLVVF